MTCKNSLFILPIVLIIGCQHQNTDKSGSTNTSESVYDSALAKQIGADDYGMRTYVMANLIAGPDRDQDSITAAKLQRAHLDNITRMAEQGTLVVAGPFMDEGDVRGIYIFAVETIAEAEELTSTDPAIKAGRLEMELRLWYGPAALMLLKEMHPKVSKKSI